MTVKVSVSFDFDNEEGFSHDELMEKDTLKDLLSYVMETGDYEVSLSNVESL